MKRTQFKNFIDYVKTASNDEYKVRNAYFQKIAWMPLPEPYKGEE